MAKIILLSTLVVFAIAMVGFAGWIFYANNAEEPPHRVVQSDGAIEIRAYPSMVVAEVTRQGDRDAAVRTGFRPLASYIFAKDRPGDSISMTAPVTQRREQIAMTAPVTQARSEYGGPDTWTIRFIMPANYTLESLPESASSDIRLLDVPTSRKAVIRFPGVATDELLAKQESLLREWLRQQDLALVEPPTFAYYNAPFTPGFLRRNEVMFDLVQ